MAPFRVPERSEGVWSLGFQGACTCQRVLIRVLGQGSSLEPCFFVVLSGFDDGTCIYRACVSEVQGSEVCVALSSLWLRK